PIYLAALGALDDVLAGRELDLVEDLDARVRDLHEHRSLVGAAVGVLEAVVGLGLVRALVERVRDAVVIAIGRHVRASVGVLEAVVRLRLVGALVALVRALVAFVGDLVAVVVRVRAAVGVLEAVFVFGDGRALVDVVGDAVLVLVADLVRVRDAQEGARLRNAHAREDARAAAGAEDHAG